MSFLDRFQAVAPADLSAFLPFRVEGQVVGYLRADHVERLAAFGRVFRINEHQACFAEGIADFAARTEAIALVVKALQREGLISPLRGEAYPIKETFDTPSLFEVDRAAVNLFGFRAYGLHVNGFVRKDDGIHMWIGKRAMDREVEPGKLDQIVAGGQPAGLTLAENLVKECAEEADLDSATALTAKPIGLITYTTAVPLGLKRDVLFNFDLELNPSFTPKNTDGEIESFQLWHIDQVAERVRETNDFKFNCSLVIIDFLIRHGLVSPDEADYQAIISRLHG